MCQWQVDASGQETLCIFLAAPALCEPRLELPGECDEGAVAGIGVVGSHQKVLQFRRVVECCDMLLNALHRKLVRRFLGPCGCLHDYGSIYRV